MAAAFFINTFFSGLSYMAAFDALDSLQILGFSPLINIEFPNNADVFLSNLVDTSHDSFIHTTLDRTVGIDMIFDGLPQRKFGLNSRYSNFGYTSIVTIQNLGYKFVILFLQTVVIGLLVIAFCGRRLPCVSKLYDKLRDWILFGLILDLILITYLPILINLFVGVAGIDWLDENLNSQIVFNNVMTIALAMIHLFIPFLIMVYLHSNRHRIGV